MSLSARRRALRAPREERRWPLGFHAMSAYAEACAPHDTSSAFLTQYLARRRLLFADRRPCRWLRSRPLSQPPISALAVPCRPPSAIAGDGEVLRSAAGLHDIRLWRLHVQGGFRSSTAPRVGGVHLRGHDRSNPPALVPPVASTARGVAQGRCLLSLASRIPARRGRRLPPIP